MLRKKHGQKDVTSDPLIYRGERLHQRDHQRLHQRVHPVDPWDRYGVIWAKNPFKGFDLLVLRTNPPARPDCQRRPT